MYPEHWQVLGACMEHDFKWAPKMAQESIDISGMGFIKGLGLKMIIGTMHRKSKKYLKNGCEIFSQPFPISHSFY